MFGQIARFFPFLMAGLLVLNLLTAITEGSRANWLMVAVIAGLLAVMLGRRGRAVATARHPAGRPSGPAGSQPTVHATAAPRRERPMGFFDRFFSKKRTAHEATAADQARSRRLTDRARSQQLEGQEVGQTAAEQAGTRGRMEAELVGQRQRREPSAVATVEAPPCPHTVLTPRWDRVADMGNPEQVSRFACQGCNQSFSPAEGRTLLATEVQRLRRNLDSTQTRVTDDPTRSSHAVPPTDAAG
jgi:hypothetical protein